jgi:hypothetical protein
MEKYLIKTPRIIATGGNTTESSSTDASRAKRPRYNSPIPQLIDLDKLPRDPAKKNRMCFLFAGNKNYL